MPDTTASLTQDPTASIRTFCAHAGERTAVLSIRRIASDAAPETLQPVPALPSGLVRVMRSELASSSPALPTPPIQLAPANKRQFAFDFEEGTDFVLPAGVYQFVTMDSSVRAVLSQERVAVAPGATHIITYALQAPLRALQFRIRDSVGNPVRRAQVDIFDAAAPPDRPRVLSSRGVLDLQESWFWIVAGPRHVRITYGSVSIDKVLDVAAAADALIIERFE
jgi:hypothetical protein